MWVDNKGSFCAKIARTQLSKTLGLFIWREWGWQRKRLEMYTVFMVWHDRIMRQSNLCNIGTILMELYNNTNFAIPIFHEQELLLLPKVFLKNGIWLVIIGIYA